MVDINGLKPEFLNDKMEDSTKKIIELEDLSMDIIADQPWAKDMLQSLQKTTERGFLNWVNRVNKLGVDQVELDEWKNVMLRHVDHLYCDFVYDLEMLVQKMFDRIQKLVETSFILSKKLRIENISIHNYERMSLFEVNNCLKRKCQEYERRVVAIEQRLHALNKRAASICTVLGRKHQPLPSTPLPTDEELDRYNEQVEQLEQEKYERAERFIEMRMEVSDIAVKLNYTPSLDYEAKLLTAKDDTFASITNEDVEQLICFHARLKKLYDDVVEKVAELRKNIDTLWDQLDIDMMYRDTFRRDCTGYSLDALEQLKNEMIRCRELKKANIKRFVEKLRVSLKEWWDKCYCTQRDRDKFQMFDSETYTEDLLELYELEISKWRKYYEENEAIFKLIEKYTNVWDKWCTLELKTDEPNRYKNRGGKLLFEEKERNKLIRNSNKLREDLLKAAQQYHDSTGRHLFLNGMTVDEFIIDKEHNFEQSKKQLLTVKKQEREKVLSIAKSPSYLYPSTSTSRFALTPQTPQSAIKKRLFLTPMNDLTKKTKIGTNKSKSCAVKVTALRKRISTEKKKKTDRKRLSNLMQKEKNKPKGKNSNCNSTSCSDYDVFEREVSHPDCAKSSLLPTKSKIF